MSHQEVQFNNIDPELYVSGVLDHGIKLLSFVREQDGEIVSFDEEFYPAGVSPFGREGVKQFKAWCREREIHYYAKCDEEFSAAIAQIEAKQKNAKYLLWEAMG